MTEGCTICSSRSRRPVRKLLDTLRFVPQKNIHINVCTVFVINTLLSWIMKENIQKFI